MDATSCKTLNDRNKSLEEFHLAFNTRNWDKLKELLNGPFKDTDKEFVYQIQEIFEKRQHLECSSLLCQHQDAFDYNNILNEFKEYYLHQFNEDLLSYYDFKPFGSRKDIAFSSQCDRTFNKGKTIKDMTPKKFCYFSLSVYFISLFPQIIGFLFGQEVMEDCFRCTGFPWLNCGMAGLSCPIEIIRESNLAPDDNRIKIEDYLFVFNKIRKFAQNDFIEFFDGKHKNLNNEAYKHVIEVLCQTGNRRLFRDETWFQFGLFRQWIMNPTIKFTSNLVSLK